MNNKGISVVENENPATSAVQTAQVVEEKKGIVNCPKCGTALRVKVGNIAYLCPVCSQMFRTRLSEKLVKDVTNERMVEAFITLDKDAAGQVKTSSVIADK